MTGEKKDFPVLSKINSPADLKKLGWKTHYSVAQIENVLELAGLETVKRIDMTPEPYSLWLTQPSKN